MANANMMLSLPLALAIPLLLGFSLLALLWFRHEAFRSHLVLKVCLAMAIGLGISSCAAFIWLSTLGATRAGFVIVEASLLIVSMAILWSTRNERASPRSSEPHSAVSPDPKMFIAISLAFYAALALGIVVFLALSRNDPHGGYDGWEIWNMHARFMFRGGQHWRDYLSDTFHYSHPDYPLLLPASIARGWLYVGRDTVLVPIAIAMFFTFATAGVLVSAIAMLRSTTQGLLAGVILLATPSFVSHGASQYADVPLGFFFLATVVLFTLQETSAANNDRLLTLAGVTAGLSAWTKNEGLLFVAAVIIAHGAVATSFRGHKAYLRQARSFSAGLLPLIAVVLYFKMAFATRSDLFVGQGFHSTMERLIDVSRYVEVAKSFVRGFFSFGHWSPIVNVLVLLCFYSLVSGIEIGVSERIAVFHAGLLLVLMLGGYFFLYIFTPHPLLWHLSTSLERLLLQLWPTLVFCFFLLVRTMEKGLMSGSQG